jgi:hypothetical protein
MTEENKLKNISEKEESIADLEKMISLTKYFEKKPELKSATTDKNGNEETQKNENQKFYNIKQKIHNDKQLLELEALKKKYAAYVNLTSEDLDAKLIDLKKTKCVYSGTESTQSILNEYIKLYKDKDGNYSKGHSEPKHSQDGKITLEFESEKDAMEFSLDMAASGREFIMTNEEGKIIAFSNGNGKLYQPGAGGTLTELDENSPLTPTDIDIKDFKQSDYSTGSKLNIN